MRSEYKAGYFKQFWVWVFIDTGHYYAVLESFLLSEKVIDPWQMREKGSSDFEDSIIVEPQVFFSQLVLAKNFDGEMEGGVVVEKESCLSFVATGRFAELVTHFTHVCVDQHL